jgi:peptidoglycan/xylan/chitin deacetylase (PgdA/CDA1 family)
MAAYKKFFLIWLFFILVLQLLWGLSPGELAPKLPKPQPLSLHDRFGSIRGRVVSRATGYPIRGASVAVNGVTILTDAEGRFAINELRPGIYDLSYRAAVHGSQVQQDVRVRRNTTATLPTVILAPRAGSVAGKVVNAGNGGPVVGAKVTMGASSTTTDGEGNFSFQLVEPGTYRIVYYAPGNLQVQENISVVEGGTTVPPNVIMPVFPQVHYGSREKRRIAITVDDGFRRDYGLVNLLKSHGVKATAFMVGDAARRHPEFVRYLASSGWEIANHTYTHSNPLEQSSEQIVNELQSAQRVISSITGRQSPFVRLPKGNGDPQVIGAVNGGGYTAAFWSLDLLDTRKNIPLETQVKEVLDKARGGDILVCHFGGNNTSKALSIIIPELRARGFAFVTLSELFE